MLNKLLLELVGELWAVSVTVFSIAVWGCAVYISISWIAPITWADATILGGIGFLVYKPIQVDFKKMFED